jgi:GYF domain 2
MGLLETGPKESLHNYIREKWQNGLRKSNYCYIVGEHHQNPATKRRMPMSGKKWFYAVNNQQNGPIDEATMQQFIQKQTINARTLVWQEGMPSWTALQNTSLQAIIPMGSAPMIVQPAPAPKVYTADSFNQLFMWCWILLAGSILIPFASIGYIVVFYILLYRCWSLIQDGSARTTPGKAVGFGFIPYFSYYWVFVAIRGLAQDMNRYCREHSIPAPVINEELAFWRCILTACNLIPGLNLLTGIAASVVNIILFNTIVQSAIAITNAKNINR